MPADVAAGAHQVEVRGAVSGSVFLDLTVVEGLAASGGDDAAWFALGGAGALLLGAGVTIAMRRRRAAVQG